MTSVDVEEVPLEDQLRAASAHDKDRKHFAAAIEYFDEELGPGIVLARPQLLAAFVNAAALEGLAIAIANAGRQSEHLVQ